jgi:dTMP kinase
MSLFITFEGGEGSGKSFQSRALYRRLVKLAIPVVLTHEPGVTSLGKKITRWLKWGDGPELENSKVVICDRYADSTTAYQSYGRGLDLGMVRAANEAAMQGVVPDLTILLDISAGTGFTRKKGQKPDRFERETADFHHRVREGYLKLAEKESERWLVVNASQSRERIARIIWEKVSSLLKK